MVKSPTKPRQKQNNTIITINNVPKEHKTPKSRQQIYSENYQKNKERKKAQQKERYLKRKS